MKITEADIIAYAEAEWERRAANVPEGRKGSCLHLTVVKNPGEAAKLRLMWNEETDSPPLEQG